jgi:leucine dehydrogenase
MEEFNALISSWSGEAVLSKYDHPSGSWIFIALHDFTLGNPSGGTRIQTYPTPQEGLLDALRLAEGMTYKWAAIDFPHGGGKAVIATPGPIGGEERVGLLRRYGRLIETLNGLFATGADMGTTEADIAMIGQETRFVHGLDENRQPVDPGPFTAYGVYCGLCEALRAVTGSADPSGVTVLIQGLGDVGGVLARRLETAGAKLLLTDLNTALAENLAEELEAEVVAPDDIYTTSCEVYSPCAIGATLNRDTIPRLNCKAVAGSANNQLAEPADAEQLHERGILYAPDYIINAGGAMSLGLSGSGSRDPQELFTRVEAIGRSLAEIFSEAAQRSESPVYAARRRVERILQAATDQPQ